MAGVFVTIEGGDATGKSSQVKALLEFLTEQGVDFVATREPGGTPLAEAIRQLVLSPEYEMSVITEALLYAAARAEHTRQVVVPALNAGKLVISERYVDSSLAYQAFGGGLPEQFVAKINEMATGALVPTRTILFDLDPSLAAARRQRELDRIEGKGLEFHQEVRLGYLELAKAEPERFRIIDASQPADVVQAEVRRFVLEVLPKERKGEAK